MAEPRFHTPQTRFEIGREVVLPQKARHHAGRVLRLLEGSRVRLFDGNGNLAGGSIRFAGADAFVLIDSIETPQVESPVDMTLLQAMVEPKKLDLIVEKAVETGVRHIGVVPLRRCITKLSGERLDKRLEHLRDVAVSACEQCGRNVVPDITFYQDAQTAFSSQQAQLKLILATDTCAKAPAQPMESVAFAVGPEGGFDPEEVELAKSLGWRPTTLGPRILRTETAGIVAATLINAISGEIRVI